MEEINESELLLSEIQELKPYLSKQSEINKNKQTYKDCIRIIIKSSIMGSILIYPVGLTIYKYKVPLTSLFYNSSDMTMKAQNFGNKVKYMMILWTIILIGLAVYGYYKQSLWNKEKDQMEGAIKESNDFINNKEWFIPEGYRNLEAVEAFEKYLKEGRAFTKQQCINYYTNEMNHMEVIRLLKEVRVN